MEESMESKGTREAQGRGEEWRLDGGIERRRVCVVLGYGVCGEGAFLFWCVTCTMLVRVRDALV